MRGISLVSSSSRCWYLSALCAAGRGEGVAPLVTVLLEAAHTPSKLRPRAGQARLRRGSAANDMDPDAAAKNEGKEKEGKHETGNSHSRPARTREPWRRCSRQSLGKGLPAGRPGIAAPRRRWQARYGGRGVFPPSPLLFCQRGPPAPVPGPICVADRPGLARAGLGGTMQDRGPAHRFCPGRGQGFKVPWSRRTGSLAASIPEPSPLPWPGERGFVSPPCLFLCYNRARIRRGGSWRIGREPTGRARREREREVSCMGKRGARARVAAWFGEQVPEARPVGPAMRHQGRRSIAAWIQEHKKKEKERDGGQDGRGRLEQSLC